MSLLLRSALFSSWFAGFGAIGLGFAGWLSPQPLHGVEAQPLLVELRPAAPVEDVAPVEVWLRPIGETEAPGAPATRLARPGTTTEFPVPASGDYQLTCRSETVWCPEISFTAADAPKKLILPLFPAARLFGQVVVPKAEEPPSRLLLQGWVALDGPEDPLEFSFEIPLAGEAFAAAGPRAPLDLRLAAEGWIPVYLWGASPDDRGELVLGSIPLQRGSSLCGFVVDSLAEGADEGARVLLEEMSAPQASTQERARAGRRDRQTTTNSRGFFQIGALAPGNYRLTVEAPGRATVTLEPLSVLPEAETCIFDVSLAPPLILEVAMSPPAQPSGEPWSVQIVPADQGSFPRRAVADQAGLARFVDLPPGLYSIDLLGEKGARWLSIERRLDASARIDLEVDLVEVAGRIRLGEEPLVARLEIRTGQGDETRLESDSQGSFGGWIPTPRSHFLLIAITAPHLGLDRQIEVRAPEIEDGVLRLDLELEEARIEGRVVSREGEEVPGARVVALSETGGRFETDSDRDGRFAFPSLAPGSYRLTASEPTLGVAGSIDVEAREGAADEHLLVLEPAEERLLRVTSAEGSAVAGATVTAFFAGATTRSVSGLTDARGEWRLDLPPEASRLMVRVEAPSLLLWAGCLDVPRGALDVVLPPLPGGELEITLRGDPAKPPATGGRLLLLTEQGGFLELSDLVGWNVKTTGALGIEGLTSTLARYRASGLAPSQYAIHWSSRPWWQLVPQLCTLGAGYPASWRYLPPGGRLELAYDVSRHQ